MTCVAAVETQAGIVMGADSASVDDHLSLTVVADDKVFERGPFLIGFTSSWRMGSLLRYGAFDPDTRTADDDVDAFMHTRFIDAVRSCLKQGGYARVDNNVETGGTFLVGFRGRLYVVHGDFQVARSAAGFNAVGCGADLALGALHATAGEPGEQRVTAALAAAETFSAGVRSPFRVISQSRSTGGRAPR